MTKDEALDATKTMNNSWAVSKICKNCKYYVHDNDDILNSILYNGFYAYFVPDENFCCCYFERRKNESSKNSSGSKISR